MKETGILFTPENHRAILNKTKWQTRRVMRKQPSSVEYWLHGEPSDSHNGVPVCRDEQGKGWTNCGPFKSPYGRIGDKIYIKEGIIIDKAFDPPELAGYYMDGARATLPNQKRLTAMFMAKRYARTWLELTDVWVERIQDISEKDCIAEGIIEENVIMGANCNGGIHREESALRYFYTGGDDDGYETAVEAYADLWDSINKVKHPWKNNDFVWCLSFRVI